MKKNAIISIYFKKNQKTKHYSKMETKKKFHGMPDKANCTYWWRIYLDRSHPDNKPTVETIDGYSKFQNNDEAKDKDDVLMAKCEMLYKNGYLNRATHIEIYLKKGAMPSVHEDLLILILQKNDYKLSPIFLKNTNWRMQKFLHNYYEAIKGGRPALGLRPLKDKQAAQVDEFDISIYNFKTHSELYAKAEQFISLGRAPERVLDFVRRYEETRFGGKDPMKQLMELYQKNQKK